ncbi:MAG: hypothetical protein HY721_09560 [Planctomycetes bacterium]|nr:hypothetical protein [Planctomycetota bacterium]
MTTQDDSSKKYRRLARLVRAWQAEEKAPPGGVDDETLACFVTGLCSETERQRVEKAMAADPDLREAVSILRSEVAAAEPSASWELGKAGARLVERLRVWLDETGETLARGLGHLLEVQQTQLGWAVHMGHGSVVGTRPAGAAWRLPLPGKHCVLALELKPQARAEWEARVRLDGEDAAIVARSTLTVARSGEVPEVQGPLESLLGKPLPLGAGDWEIRLVLGGESWSLPLTVGGSGTTPGH